MVARQLSQAEADGTVIGQSAADKVGFFGATPVAQRAGAAQAVSTDAASVIVLANELRAAMVALGLIKGSA